MWRSLVTSTRRTSCSGIGSGIVPGAAIDVARTESRSFGAIRAVMAFICGRHPDRDSLGYRRRTYHRARRIDIKES